MSVSDEAVTGRTPAPQPATTAGRIPRWLPAVILMLAVLGALAVLPSLGVAEGARDWYRDQVGGSSLYSLDVIFARLLPFLIGGGIALALLQRGRRQRAHAQLADSLQRHELTEVITHWMNAAGIGLGLITAAWLLRWFENPFSLQTAYALHFLGAGLTVTAVAHHLTYQVIGGGSGLLPRSGSDVKNAFAEVIGYTGVYRGLRGVFDIQLPAAIRRPVQRLLRRYDIAPEPAGKYLATEKVFSYSIWAALIAIVVVTGIIKTLAYVVPLPGGLRQAMSFLHDGVTILLVLFLILHVAALVLVPRNWPLLASMFTTRISRAYAKTHLPRWNDER